MYKIMSGNKVIAIAKKEKSGVYMEAIEGIPQHLLPIALFGWDKRRVSMLEVIDWASSRCFPPDRVDADRILKEMGLDRYDPWEIAKITKAKLISEDKFWIDF